MRILFTPLAERQLDKLHDYIASRSGEERADRYVGRIIACCEKLQNFPLRGTPRDDLLQGLRILGFERRVTIAYIVTPDTVLIEGVFYAGQDFERTFLG